MTAGGGYLLDSGVVSAIRSSGLSPSVWIGSDDLAVSVVVVDEIFVDLPDDDAKFLGNVELLTALPPALPTDERVVSLAEDLVERYAAHQPPLAPNDALIAAAAISAGRALVTKNRRDFHYIDGLAMVDAVGFDPRHGALLAFRAALDAGPSDRPCCRELSD